ncbi:MAG TPA: hypothetical protein VLH15_02365 [Dehalococcoidales bacterium]|nr:hypothetical protein [Dehalococcoidales bacterium]
MSILYGILALIMLFFIVLQIRNRIPRIISFFSPGKRNLSFQDQPDPPVDEIHMEMAKPLLEKMEAGGFKQLGYMVEKAPLWSRSTRELVMVSASDKIIASIGFRGLKSSYFLYTPFEGGQVVITAHNCFRNYIKPDFMTTEVKSGDLDEMLESHKNDVESFIAKGYVPFRDYSREAVMRATNQYYKSSYPATQLRVAGVINSLFFIVCLLIFYLLVRAAFSQ